MEDKIREYEIFVEARKLANYYKGEILPFIHKLCRKEMTTGDIDAFIWDYDKKFHYIIEQKLENEKSKESQNKHLRFLYDMYKCVQENYFKDWIFGVYKIKGNPPFEEATIYEYPFNDNNNSITINQEELIDFFNLKVTYDDLKNRDHLFE